MIIWVNQLSRASCSMRYKSLCNFHPNLLWCMYLEQLQHLSLNMTLHFEKWFYYCTASSLQIWLCKTYLKLCKNKAMEIFAGNIPLLWKEDHLICDRHLILKKTFWIAMKLHCKCTFRKLLWMSALSFKMHTGILSLPRFLYGLLSLPVATLASTIL